MWRIIILKYCYQRQVDRNDRERNCWTMLDIRDLALVRTVSFQFYRPERNLELLVYRDVLINRQLISMYAHECCGSIVARESGDNVISRECDRLSRKRNYSRITIEFESIGFNNSFRIIDEIPRCNMQSYEWDFVYYVKY